MKLGISHPFPALVRAFLLQPEDVALREAEHRRRHDVEDVGVVLVEGPRRLVVEGPRVEGERHTVVVLVSFSRS